MKERIAFIIKTKCKNKTEFAKRIKVSQAFVSQLCSGVSNPSDHTISDICREFGVDRMWLETGEGEPFREEPRNEQIAKILGQAIVGNDTARDRLIRAFCQLPDELFPDAERILDEIIENLQKEREEGEYDYDDR